MSNLQAPTHVGGYGGTDASRRFKGARFNGLAAALRDGACFGPGPSVATKNTTAAKVPLLPADMTCVGYR